MPSCPSGVLGVGHELAHVPSVEMAQLLAAVCACGIQGKHAERANAGFVHVLVGGITTAQSNHRELPRVEARKFEVTATNHVWVSDLTHLDAATELSRKIATDHGVSCARSRLPQNRRHA